MMIYERLFFQIKNMKTGKTTTFDFRLMFTEHTENKKKDFIFPNNVKMTCIGRVVEKMVG